MTRFSISMLASGMMLAICGGASAENHVAVKFSFLAHQVSTLEAKGYHSVRDTHDGAERVTAIDADGNEVLVTFNVDQGTILRVTNLHLLDD